MCNKYLDQMSRIHGRCRCLQDLCSVKNSKYYTVATKQSKIGSAEVSVANRILQCVPCENLLFVYEYFVNPRNTSTALEKKDGYSRLVSSGRNTVPNKAAGAKYKKKENAHTVPLKLR